MQWSIWADALYPGWYLDNIVSFGETTQGRPTAKGATIIDRQWHQKSVDFRFVCFHNYHLILSINSEPQPTLAKAVMMFSVLCNCHLHVGIWKGSGFFSAMIFCHDFLHGAFCSNTQENKPPDVLVWRRSAGGVPHNLSLGLHSSECPLTKEPPGSEHTTWWIRTPWGHQGSFSETKPFVSSAPHLWNKLPEHLSAAMTVRAFKSGLNCIGTSSFLSFKHTFILLWSSMTNRVILIIIFSNFNAF